MFKKMVSLMLILTLSLGMSLGVFANNVTNSDSLITDFENQMLHQLELTDGTEKAELLTEFEKYNALSKSEKLQFIEVSTDVDLLMEVFESSKFFKTRSGQETSKTSLSNGLVVESTITDTPSNSINQRSVIGLAATESRVAEYKKYVSVLGIKVFQVTNTLRYERTGYDGQITSITSSNHRVTRNFTILQVDYSGENNKILTGNITAKSEMDVTVSGFVSDTWVIGDGKSNIYVDVQEAVWGDFWFDIN